VLKLGYILMLTAGGGLLAYGLYRIIEALVRLPGVHPWIKALILCAGAGVLMTLIGLIIEKKKEDKHDAGDDERDRGNAD
jgi:Co/Zn/Cd efflux system component